MTKTFSVKKKKCLWWWFFYEVDILEVTLFFMECQAEADWYRRREEMEAVEIVREIEIWELYLVGLMKQLDF